MESICQGNGEEHFEIQTRAVYVGDHLFEAYPVVHQLRRRHIPVLALLEKNGEKRVVRPIRFLRKNWTISRITLIITDTKRLWALFFSSADLYEDA